METIQSLIQQITRSSWRDWVDILVVAFLIYRLLPLLRTHNTMRIAKAVLALVLISWATDFLQLHTLHFILNQFLTIGLLALVVLFQPELRRMLDHLGSVKISTFLGPQKPQQELDSIISQTVMACEIMSRERVGALMVFARSARLEEQMRTGTRIDGLVSEQLIRNIFFTNAALHDGAMIIRDGRIAAAGCVLPLSDSHRLSADLGTRHRAGLGMSEASDAVVVIVSEETGTISVALGGMLKRHLAPQTLERLLRQEIRQTASRPVEIVHHQRQPAPVMTKDVHPLLKFRVPAFIVGALEFVVFQICHQDAVAHGLHGHTHWHLIGQEPDCLPLTQPRRQLDGHLGFTHTAQTPEERMIGRTKLLFQLLQFPIAAPRNEGTGRRRHRRKTRRQYDLPAQLLGKIVRNFPQLLDGHVLHSG